MLTDVRPIVERLLRKLVLAGWPLVTACQEGGGPVMCEPQSITCGSRSLCLDPGGGTSQSLPLTTGGGTFTFDDGRLADYYRACAASNNSCGPECRGFCLAAAGFSPTASGQYYFKCDVTCGAQNGVQVSYEGAVCGRRPTGASRRRRYDRHAEPRAESLLGRLLAEAAELEAASVPAFANLAADLTAHGAPEALVRAARGAMADEARHWRGTRDLARRKGGAPVRPTFTRGMAAPSLQELAADNIVEGCVRETFGALVAAHQAARAADREIAGLMTTIADDEMNHAALAWRIDAWAAQRLGDSFRARRSSCARAALHELAAAATRPLEPGLRAAAGLPDPAEAAALLAATWNALWKPAFSQPEAENLAKLTDARQPLA